MLKYNHNAIRHVGRQEAPMKMRHIAATLAALWAGFYGTIEYSNQYKLEQERMKKEQAQWSNANNVDIGRGDWTLLDCKTNSPITKDDLKDKWLLMYFGFAHCPDICPETMEKVMDIVDIHKLEQKTTSDLPDIHPVFITIDPDRDTPEKLADYLSDYPHFLGLTGTMAQIKSVTKNYRIYFSMGPKSDDGDYILDHSIVIYLINPNGVYQNHFMDRAQPPEDIYTVVRQQFKLFDKFNSR